MWDQLMETMTQRPPRILVVGDLMLDRYTWGQVERISPEAPVAVLGVEREEVRLGGAASVAMLARGLGAKVQLAGVLGCDLAATVMRRILGESRIGDSLVLKDDERPTTSKERVLGHCEGRSLAHLLRVDREECAPISAAIEQRILAGIGRILPKTDVVLVSDYAKGVCTPILLQGIIGLCRDQNIAVLIDPCRRADYSRYRGATLLKPNRSAAALASGRAIHSIDDARQAARQLCDQHELNSVVITLDREGMVVCEWDSEPVHIPAAVSKVTDITGAGDTMLAALGCGWAARLGKPEMLELARLAAAAQIERLGVEAIQVDEIRDRAASCRPAVAGKITSSDDLSAIVKQSKGSGKRVVFTNGCFDLLHIGHVKHLQEAARLGDILVVAINSDAAVRRLKGTSRPLIAQADRAAMLAALSCVNYVTVFDEPTPHHLLKLLEPDVLVKGGTYTLDQVVGHEVVESYGGQVCVTPPTPGVSTTLLADRIDEQRQPGDELELAGAGL